MSSPQSIINQTMNESDVTAKHSNEDYVLVDEQKKSLDCEPLISLGNTSIPESLLSQFCDRVARLHVMLRSLTTSSYSDELQGTFESFLACTTTSALFCASKESILTLFEKIPKKYEPLTEEFMNHVITKSSTNFGLSEICSGFEMLHSKAESKLAKPLAKRLYRIFLDFLELDFRTLVEFSSVKTSKSSMDSSVKHRFIALNMLLLAEKRYRSANAEYMAKETRHLRDVKMWEREAIKIKQHNNYLTEKIENAHATLESLQSRINYARTKLQRATRTTSETLHRSPPKFDPPTLARAFNRPLDCTISKKESSQDSQREQSASLKENHAAKTESCVLMLESSGKLESNFPKERGETSTTKNNHNWSDIKQSCSIKDDEASSIYSSRHPFCTKSLRPASRTLQIPDAYKAIGAEIKNLANDPRLEDRLQTLYRHIGSQCDRLTRELTENQKSSTGAELSSQIDHSMLFDLHLMIYEAEHLLDKQH